MDENQDLNPWQELPKTEAEPADLDALETEEEAAQKKARSRKWWIIGAVAVVFLVAAAFLGAQLLRPQQNMADKDDGGMRLSVNKAGGGGAGPAKSVRIEMTPAPEVPVARPAASGLFVRREDQSIFIGTGNISIMAKRNSNAPEESEMSSKYDGPVVEVVVTHDTQIYKDTTDMFGSAIDEASGDNAVLQQKVEPGSLDDLGKNSTVSVWGEKQGDRYIANTIVFR